MNLTFYPWGHSNSMIRNVDGKKSIGGMRNGLKVVYPKKSSVARYLGSFIVGNAARASVCGIAGGFGELGGSWKR